MLKHGMAFPKSGKRKGEFVQSIIIQTIWVC